MSFPKALLFIAFLTAFGLSYMGPVIEGDFFWHLRAGQTIWENKGMPSEFSTQWLGQFILYLIWRVSGFTGIVFLRVAVYTAIMGFIFFWMRREKVQFFICLFFLLFPARILMSFPSERPQIFTFLLFPLSVYMLEELRKSDKGPGLYWLLPPLMLLWANIHAGFVIGFACLGIYLFSGAISFIRKETSLRKLAVMAIISISPAVLLLFINPKAMAFMAGTAVSLFTPGSYMKSVQEYLSPLTAALHLGQYYPAYWFFLLIACMVLLRGLRRMPLVHILILVLFIGLSLRSLRFMPFLCMLAPLVAVHGFRQQDEWEKSKAVFAGFTVILALWLIFTPMNIKAGISEEFPRDAARFLRQAAPRGNIFNYQGWAGYLLWAVPERKIFMGVEGVTSEIDNAYEKVIWASRTTVFGRPEWRAILDAYGLNIVIMPGMSPISGEIYPLIGSLSRDRDWYLIYSDSVSNIFVRKSSENSGLISVYSLPKANVYLQIISQAKRYLEKEPDRAVLRRSLGTAYKRLGRLKEAQEALGKVK